MVFELLTAYLDTWVNLEWNRLKDCDHNWPLIAYSLLDHFPVPAGTRLSVQKNEICTHIVYHALWSLYSYRNSTCKLNDLNTHFISLLKNDQLENKR